ncbi:hypothetical protein FDP41_000188 [Naegleria fowleri]|uniref:Uncharacterized protein n=1 Tax=Naegleria fowleri TaxID=5763 RepID=A0A6A5CIP6_NAEFO|nr:uncharacterized protein FDP41_000188 [Naegleria fowleri]KAF0985149.1 hypothetical protein FDP41_000188 [Naegleria fowleri]CAG4708801.1 unnamed protein product [Naegleria fowleri]
MKTILVEEENEDSRKMEMCEMELTKKLSELQKVIDDLAGMPSSNKSSQKYNYCTLHENCLILRPISIDGEEYNDACAPQGMKEQADIIDEDSTHQLTLEKKLHKFMSLWHEFVQSFTKKPLSFLKSQGITTSSLKQQTFHHLNTIHKQIIDYSQKIHRTQESLSFAVCTIPYYLSWIEQSSDFRAQFETQFKEFIKIWEARYKEILHNLRNSPTEMYLFEHYYGSSVIDQLKMSSVYDKDILTKLEACLNLNFQTLRQLSAEQLK